MDRSMQLGELKISKLLLKFSIPAIIGMLVNALYNVVDRIFIGQGVGSLGIGATTLAFPVMLIMMAFSMLIGIGANSLVSIRLGQNRKEEAEGIFGNALVLLIITSLVLSVVGLVFLEPFLVFMNASEQILPYAKEYLQIILIGGLFQSIGMGMNNFIRSEGNPKIAMYTMLIGAIINTVLDPVFIFIFHWGMRGAAIATILSQAVSAIWVMLYFLRGKSLLRLHMKSLRLRLKYIGNIIAIGASPFAMQIAASILNFIMNKGLITYGGDIAISGMGIVNSITTLMIMPIFGINQGVQPIIGFNYGAKKYDRVKEAYKLAVLFATIIVVVGWIFTRLFPQQLVYLFNRKDQELISFGTMAIKRFLIFLPIIGFQIVSSNYFQAVGKPLFSALLGLSRQVLILIPALLILPLFFGLNGIISAGPLSDVISSLITGIFIIREMRKLDTQHEEVKLSIASLPDDGDNDTLN
jgi:putative MATE family efflux protein